ncbi:MAG: alpha-amylase family glycosyl hydrolase, partial [Treponema sp.]|nr:alpha-amylase family glycosyl hydrolase [Treponema sp.]
MHDPQTRLKALLERLYPGRGLQLLEPLLAALRRHFPRGPADTPIRVGGTGPAFSSADAILITYADMLRGVEGRGGVGGGGGVGSRGGGAGSPLAALADFAERRLAGLVSHLHILPFFPSSSDEGFSVMDYRAVNPAFGTWEDIARLGKSFGLAFDLVLNHASVRGEWFRSFLEGREPYARFFVTRPEGYDASLVFRPRTHPLLTPFVRADGAALRVWTTFSADQADLDYSSPELLLEIVDVLLGYLARGARIVRLDAIAYAWKEDGTSCVDRPQVHVLVKLLRALIELAGGGAALLTETNLPHEVNLSYFGLGDEAQLVYNFALPPLVLHAFQSGEAEYLAAWAASLPEPAPDRAFVNFLASHDGIGLTPARGLLPEAEVGRMVEAVRARGGLVSERSGPEGPLPYELNCSFLDALADPAAPVPERVRVMLAAHAAMLSLAGVPALYFHSLVGSGNWKDGPRVQGSARSINRERLDAAALERELDDPASLRHAVFEGLGALLRERARRSAFAPSAAQRVLAPDGSGGLLGTTTRRDSARSAAPARGGGRGSGGPLFGLVRGAGADSVVALVNVSSRPFACALPRGFRPGLGSFAAPAWSAGAGEPDDVRGPSADGSPVSDDARGGAA